MVTIQNPKIKRKVISTDIFKYWKLYITNVQLKN